jgi:protocatechuate 3,4-dioxygenase beta subunit
MVSVKRLFNFSLLLASGVAQFCFISNAQTPDNKPKATVSVAGRVTIGDKPAPGITVTASTLSFPQTLIGQTVSDAEGKYRMSGLMPGQVNVSAVAPTYVMPVSPTAYPGQTLNLSADEAIEGIDFKLTRGAVITGRVTDSEGRPVIEERVTLTLLDEKGQPSRAQLSRAANFSMYSTDDRGIYRIYGLSAGRYKVSAGDSGGGASLRSGYYQRTYHPDVTDVAKAVIVELGEGVEAKNIDIALGARSRTYTVSGHIIDADSGQPMVGIAYAFGALQQNQTQTMMAGFYSPSTPTNSKGEFRLEGVAPGKYAVMTLRNAYAPNPDQPKVYSDPVPFEVTDSDVNDLEVKAQRGLTISGVVITDGITNKAVLAGLSRLIVTGFALPNPTGIQSFGNNTTSPIAADGTFQLEGLRPGKVSLSLGAFSASESRGYTISRLVTDHDLPNRQIELAQGQNVSGVRIYLQYGSGVLRGEVKITGGTLPADAMLYVTLQRENQPRVASAQVDARGRFTLSGIPAGSYDALLQIMSFGADTLPSGIPRTQRQTVNVSDDAEAQITFTLDLTRKEGP